MGHPAMACVGGAGICTSTTLAKTRQSTTALSIVKRQLTLESSLLLNRLGMLSSGGLVFSVNLLMDQTCVYFGMRHNVVSHPRSSIKAVSLPGPGTQTCD